MFKAYYLGAFMDIKLLLDQLLFLVLVTQLGFMLKPCSSESSEIRWLGAMPVFCFWGPRLYIYLFSIPMLFFQITRTSVFPNIPAL